MPSDGTSPSVDQNSASTRREWLKYSLGGSAALLLAGCTEEGGQAGTSGSDGSDLASEYDEILDRTMSHYTYNAPQDSNLNEYSPAASWHDRLYSNRLLSLWDSTRGQLSAENDIGMAEDWGFRTQDGTPEFWVEIKDGWKWSVGPEGDENLHNTEVTAEDIVKQERLERLMIPESERPDEPTVPRFYAEDEKTAVWELREGQYNETSQRINTLTQWFWIFVHRDGPYGDALERLQDANEDERESIRQEIIQSDMDHLEKPVSGPWRPIQKDQQRILYELNPDDIASVTQGGPLNFSNFELVWLGDTSFIQSMGANELDIHGDPVPVGASPSDNLHEIDAAELGGSLFHIRYFPEDHENSFMNEPEFRWAIAHVIDREQAAQNAGRLASPVQKQTGDEDAQVESQMPDLYPQLRAYEKNDSQAEEYLNDIGCSKEDGSWIDPNGNQITLPILAKDIQLMEPQARTIASNLDNFGIQTELSLKDETTADAQMDRQDFTAGMFKWGGFAYYPLNFTDRGWDTYGQNDRATTPDTLTAPDPVGDWESSEMMEVNGPEIFNEVQNESDPERAREMIREMCWAHNYNLPFIQITSNGSGTPINMNGKWNWPEFQEGNGTEEDWSTWITEDDHPLWAVDGPENAIIHGHGPGVRANPDYDG